MQSIKIGLKNLAKLNQTSLIYKRRNILHQMLPSSQGIFMFSSNAEKPENDPRKLTDTDWEKRLSPEQYYVCREKGTELPFSGSYYRHKEEGMYSCICCGIDLFSSKVKFESGCGWPSFYEAHGAVGGNEKNSNILRRPDNSHGMLRTEVLCKKCNAHLGHVFPDGPPPTGLRYCINSVALKFYPKKMT